MGRSVARDAPLTGGIVDFWVPGWRSIRRNGVADPRLAPFDDQNYLSLETFKKTGRGVRTPVWFVVHNDAFYVYTEADSWKVKRIRNNPRVRVTFQESASV